jgi:hypothetical protein
MSNFGIAAAELSLAAMHAMLQLLLLLLLACAAYRKSSTLCRSLTSSRACSFSSASLTGKGSGLATVLSTATSLASSSTAPAERDSSS